MVVTSAVRAPAPAVSPMSLASRLAPPLRLPGEHFAAALLFWLAGCGMLVWSAPDVVSGAFARPRVAATTHLFTLGWITTTILGALYQFLPVALGVPIRSQRAAHVGFALYVPGLALFVAGVAGVGGPALIAGAALLATGLLIFLVNLAVTLWSAPQRPVTWWAITAAALFLLATVVLGASLAGNLRWGYLGGHRFLAMGVHLHVAVFGWVMPVVIGVGHRLLPMFLLSHGADERPGKAAVALTSAGVVALLALHHSLTPARVWAIAAVLAAGVAAFLLQAALFFRHRKKPALDPGLRLAAAALVHLAVAFPLAVLFLQRGLSAPGLATAYVLTLVAGAFSLFVAGHYYKILPFLIWLHRFGPQMGKRPVPRVADLYDARFATAAAAALATGSAALIAATLFHLPGLARPAAAAYAVGALIVAAQMTGISREKLK